MNSWKKRLARALSAVLGTLGAVMMCAGAVFAEEEAAQQSSPGMGASLLSAIIPLVLAFVLIYFILMRPQQKRDKEAEQMRNDVRVGDEICTAGGLVGIVIRITEDTVVIETAGERSKIRVKKWAIHENITQEEEKQAAEKERKAAKQKGIAAAGVTPDDSAKAKKKKS